MPIVTTEEILSLVAEIRRFKSEQPGIEVKAAAQGTPRDSLRQSLSALSNRPGGGVILLGLDERQGFAITGCHDPQRLQEDIASAGAEMTPPVRPDLSLCEHEGKLIVLAEIAEIAQFDKPCFISAAGLQSGSYIRSGLSNRRMTSYEIYGFVSAREQPKFDSEPVPAAAFEDLELDALQNYVGLVNRKNPSGLIARLPFDEAICRLGIVVSDGERYVPTLAGLLTFGLYPQQFEQQLRITFVQYFGSSEEDLGPRGERFLDNRSFEGPIPKLLEDALLYVMSHFRQSSLIDGLFRRDVPEYPELALREAIVNAVAHRDYSNLARSSYIQIRLFSDRMEIQSPGGLYGTVTIDNLDSEQSTRNQLLMRMLEDLGLSENRGSGVPAMTGAMRAAHLTPPQFEDRRSSFWVTFRNHTLLGPEAVTWLNRFGSYRLSDNQRMAMLLARQNGIIANSDYRALCNVDIGVATRDLKDLCDQDVFVQLGSGRWTTYELNPHFAVSTVEHVRLSTSEAAILDYVDRQGQVTNRDVQQLLRVGRIQASRLLGRLRDSEQLVAQGKGRWTTYTRP